MGLYLHARAHACNLLGRFLCMSLGLMMYACFVSACRPLPAAERVESGAAGGGGGQDDGGRGVDELRCPVCALWHILPYAHRTALASAGGGRVRVALAGGGRPWTSWRCNGRP